MLPSKRHRAMHTSKDDEGTGKLWLFLTEEIRDLRLSRGIVRTVKAQRILGSVNTVKI